MGNAFLYQKAGKLRKIRDNYKKRLENELIPLMHVKSVVSAKPISDIKVSEGCEVEICVEPNESVSVFVDRNKVAFVPTMNRSLIRRIQDSGGRVLGHLTRKYPHSGLIEISIVEESREKSNEKSRPPATPTR